MTKLQTGICLSAVLLLFVMYFGCETKPPKQKKIEKTRVLNAESTNVQTLIKEAKDTLDSRSNNYILALEKELEGSKEDTTRVALMKQLSGKWFSVARPDIAGGYAEKIAEIEDNEESWSISGTTFAICAQRMNEARIRDYCTSHAVKAFENAISINPASTTNKVNLAICFTDNPPPNNPMKGVLMLRDLLDKEPNDPLVLGSLGRLAIRTGQFEKAKERLEQAYSIAPENAEIICLLAQTYTSLNDTENAAAFAEKCSTMK